MRFVAASNSSEDEKARTDYVCDGLGDDVEIQSMIDGAPGGGLGLLRDKYQANDWFQDAARYWAEAFPQIESRLKATSACVTVHADNRATYSRELAGTLKEAGSSLDSLLRRLLTGARGPAQGKKYEFPSFRSFLTYEVPDIHRRSVTFRPRFPGGVVVPFEALQISDGTPEWWTSFNKVKHEESTEYRRGNLENALTAVAALALLGQQMGIFVSDELFANVGIAYPEDSIDLSAERRLFPSPR